MKVGSWKSVVWALLVAATALLATSCEEGSKKKAATAPPAQAQAPELSQPIPAAPVAPPHEPTKPELKSGPAEALIAAVESEYQAGRAEYNAGHLESAKQRFDHAFDLLVSSPFSIRDNDRLQHEFDKLVEGVHSLELVALKQGDGFTEQSSEPAPIDEANEITFPVDPNIRAKAEEEVKITRSDLPLILNDAVASYIGYFSGKGRGTIEHALVRSGRYKDMIQRVLREEGVPQDLIYLAQAESGFHPLALSRAGARGMWQFMAGRASLYGLQRDWWVDERQDPEKSTRAAARHLKDLYNDFGDWYLAMAAYNSGPGTVQNAVQRTGYADYWELYRRGVLPQETRNYVPIILAVTIMAKNPQQYGLEHLALERPVAGDTVTINYPVDLRLVAECVDSSASQLQELNPSLLRMTTPKDEAFDLQLPLGTRDKYLAAIETIPPDMRIWWRYHRVAPGDNLETVARKYHTTVQAIAEVNNLDEDQPLRTESKLVIPVAPGRQKTAEDETVNSSLKLARYKVRKGDTVTSVAEDFGVPAESLRKWNHLRDSSLRPGRTLVIHSSSSRREAGATSASAKHRPASKSAKRQEVKSRSGRHTVRAEAGDPPRRRPSATATHGTKSKTRHSGHQGAEQSSAGQRSHTHRPTRTTTTGKRARGHKPAPRD